MDGKAARGERTEVEQARAEAAWAEDVIRRVEAMLPPQAGAADRRAVTIARLVRNMAADGRGRNEPIREICARVGDRWSTLLLFLLEGGAIRHATLRRIAGTVSAEQKISQRMLTLRLRTLERDGLVERRVTPSNRPQVEYALTPIGEGLVAQIHLLFGWIRKNQSDIRAAQARFDAANGDPETAPQR